MSDSISKYYDRLDDIKNIVVDLIQQETNCTVVHLDSVNPYMWDLMYYHRKSLILKLSNDKLFLINYFNTMATNKLIKSGYIDSHPWYYVDSL